MGPYKDSIRDYRDIMGPYRDPIRGYRDVTGPYRDPIRGYRDSMGSYRGIRTLWVLYGVIGSLPSPPGVGGPYKGI